jgi:catechol 2,3-dioxygenase-like lactoylglutathione lyase family enzyme
MTAIAEIVLADDPARWGALGFAVDGDTMALGGVRVTLAGVVAGDGVPGEGFLGWTLRGISSDELDGLPTALALDDAPPPLPTDHSSHPNGVSAIDHVVAISPDLDRSVQTLRSAGLDLRRIREQPTPAGAPRQAFFRLGGVILEVVQEPPEAVERGGGAHRAAHFWGLALVADDLERTVARVGEHASEIRTAIQPGRRIATLRRSAGLAIPVALMSPSA